MLGERDWWNEREALEPQIALHALLRAIEARAPAPLAAQLGKLRGANALAATGPVDEIVMAGWRGFLIGLEPLARAKIGAQIPSPERESEPQLYAEAVATRAALAATERRYQGDKERTKALVAEIKAIGQEQRPLAREAAENALALGPTPAQVEDLLWKVGLRPSSRQLGLLSSWARDTTPRRVAKLIVRLMPRSALSQWIAALRGIDYQEAPLMEALEEPLKMPRHQSSANERQRMAEAIETLGIRTQAGRERVVEVIVKLLDQRRAKDDLDAALTLCRALGTEHDRQERLAKALKSYAKAEGISYKPKQYESILACGVELPEELLSTKAKGLLGTVAESVGEAIGSAASRARNAAPF